MDFQHQRHASRLWRVTAAVVIMASMSDAEPAAPEPRPLYNEAALVYGMGSLDTQQDAALPVHEGDVVELTGLERQASQVRGGDAMATRLEGGYIRLAPPAIPADSAGDGAMTVCLRVRDAAGRWEGPLLYWGDAQGGPAIRLQGIDGAQGQQRLTNYFNQNVPTSSYYLFNEPQGFRRVPRTTRALEATVGITPHDDFVTFYDGNMRICDSCIAEEVDAGRMSLMAPMGLVGSTEWHDIILRFDGPTLHLFVDGVLIDEEFPVGALRGGPGPIFIGAEGEDASGPGFQGLIDHIALWGRALTDAEITALSGGQAIVSARNREVFGGPVGTVQYYRPPGINIRAGDCIPYFENGVFHLFYLVVRRNHHSKWQCGHGGLQVAHATTTDLVHWRHEEIALPITEQWEGFIGTGSCVLHEGVYRWFYPVMSVLGNDASGGVYVATSSDGVHFTKDTSALAVPGASDNQVFFDETVHQYRMLSAGPKRPDGRFPLDSFLSRDLVDWTKDDEPFLLDDVAFGCPDYFEWNGWHYVVGQSPRKFWRSRGPRGPWTLQIPDELALIKVPKVAAFGEARRLTAGFLPHDGWGGEIVVWELIQHEDGSIGTKFVPEMIPASGAPTALPFEALTPKVSGDASRFRLDAEDAVQFAMLAGAPLNGRLTVRVEPKGGAGRFGICFRGAGLYEDGAELRFDPAAGTAQFGTPRDGKLAPQPDPAWFEPYLVRDVTGLDRPFLLDVVFKDDIIDASIDGRRNIITRTTRRGARLFFFAEGTSVTFDQVSVRPLSEQCL